MNAVLARLFQAGRFALLAVLLGVSLAGCGVNNIPTQEEAAKAKWSQVLNQYQRRADLIPNLVETVKGYAKQEAQVLEAVVSARARATSVQLPADVLTNPDAFKKFQDAQSQLSGALGRLLVVTEAYPELKSNQNFLALQSQLEGTENRISVARRDYIEAVQAYNTELKTFPGVIWASTLYKATSRWRRSPSPKRPSARRRSSSSAAPARNKQCNAKVLAILALLCAFVAPAAAFDFPLLDGRVIDEAHLLDPWKKGALENKLANLEAQTSRQLMVVTLASARGMTVDAYGLELRKHWGLEPNGRRVTLVVGPGIGRSVIQFDGGCERCPIPSPTISCKTSWCRSSTRAISPAARWRAPMRSSMF